MTHLGDVQPIIERLSAGLSGRYRLEREIGAGGMASVYLAEDERHHRRVAIKVLHPELSAALGTARFLKEIELTANLQHPHILPLFDSGTADGLVFYVMPFVEGESLRARLDRERQLPVADAVRIAQAVAAALEYAHKRGVVHRDIKPENILLHDGSPLVADFGIALAVQEASGQRLTQTGLSLGTPSYMAPEQAMGELSVDGRADLWALGAITYEMLAGEPPFSGPTSQAIVAKVLTATPTPLGELRKSVPPHVALAVASALEKLPSDRLAGAAAFAAALGDASARAPQTMTERPAARSGLARMMPWVAGIGIGVALGYGAFAQRTDGASTAQAATTRFLFNPPDSVQLQAVCCGQMFELSPDGRTLAFQGQSQANINDSTEHSLYLRNLDDLSIRVIAGTTGARGLSFSPDGQQLAFFMGQRIMRVAVAGGAPTQMGVLPRGYIGGSTWADADRVIAAVGRSLYELNVRDAAPRELLAPEAAGLQVGAPSFVAEGNAVLFTYSSLDVAPVVHWLPLGGGGPRRLVSGATARYVPSWKALVVVRDNQLLAYPFDPVAGDTIGPGVRIADGVLRRSPVFAFAEYTVSSNGTLAIARRAGNTPTGEVTMVTNGVASTLAFPAKEILFDHPRFSPDGTKFVVDAMDLDEQRSIYVWELARGVPQRIGGGATPARSAWTEKGDSLVVATPTGFGVRSASGTGTVRDLPTPGEWAVTRNFSVHGKWLAIEGLRTLASMSSDIVVFDRETGGAVRPLAVTDADEVDPAISPDGQWIAYSSDETGEFEVYVSPFPDATARYAVSRGGGREPVWSKDGRTLSYATNRSAMLAQSFVPGTPPRFGAPSMLDQRPWVRTWTISPDGTQMLFINSLQLFDLVGIEVMLNVSPHRE